MWCKICQYSKRSLVLGLRLLFVTTLLVAYFPTIINARVAEQTTLLSTIAVESK